MERTIARVTTMQSVNAKASKMEQDIRVSKALENSLLYIRTKPGIFGIENIIHDTMNYTVDPGKPLLEQLESLAATFVLAAQKERENATKRSRN